MGRLGSDGAVALTLRVRTLRLAADKIGGPRKLRAFLGAKSADVAAWLSGMKEPPAPIFLRALSLLLDHLDAVDPDRRGRKE
jgi:hypothetical protein